jgi:glycosyltransferase involved in cell wall biosynthesis
MRILHVPFTFAPEAMGGTEYYVQALALESLNLGHEAVIAAPGSEEATYQVGDINIFRFLAVDGPDISYGAEDSTAASSFEKILSQVRPDIVHLHAFSSAVSTRLLTMAKLHSAKTVFTYHTPTVSCFRGTMMAFGEMPCDGVLLPDRCTACTLASHGVSASLAGIGSRIPAPVGRVIGRLGLRRRHWLGIRMRALVEDGHQRFHALMAESDHVVAVCDWVGDVLQRNGVPEAKLSIIRQGLIQPSVSSTPESPEKRQDGVLKLAYFGRLDSTKGIDTLIQAVLSMPNLPLQLSVFGISQKGSETFAQTLKQLAAQDRRIAFRSPIKGPEVLKTMALFDAICVPSTWLETGPLVVYESFGAGVPVLGSRLGGISELVTDQQDGLLVEAGNVSAWADAIKRLVNDADLLPQLAQNIKTPRTMSDVAQDMHDIYQRLCSNSRPVS